MKNLQSFLQSCNKSLINQACSGPYWENIGPRSFLFAALGLYCQDLGLIFFQYGPCAWLIRYNYLIIIIIMIMIVIMTMIMIMIIIIIKTYQGNSLAAILHLLCNHSVNDNICCMTEFVRFS